MKTSQIKQFAYQYGFSIKDLLGVWGVPGTGKLAVRPLEGNITMTRGVGEVISLLPISYKPGNEDYIFCGTSSGSRTENLKTRLAH